jgi:hypothetical protein
MPIKEKVKIGLNWLLVKLKNKLYQFLPSSPSTNQHTKHGRLFSKGLLSQNTKSSNQNSKILKSLHHTPHLGLIARFLVKLKKELYQLLPSSPSTHQHQTWPSFFFQRDNAPKLKTLRTKLKNSKISTLHHNLRDYCTISCEAKERVMPTPSFLPSTNQHQTWPSFFPKGYCPKTQNTPTKTKKFYSRDN